MGITALKLAWLPANLVIVFLLVFLWLRFTSCEGLQVSLSPALFMMGCSNISRAFGSIAATDKNKKAFRIGLVDKISLKN
jgi:hypothetical protein